MKNLAIFTLVLSLFGNSVSTFANQASVSDQDYALTPEVASMLSQQELLMVIEQKEQLITDLQANLGKSYRIETRESITHVIPNGAKYITGLGTAISTIQAIRAAKFMAKDGFARSTWKEVFTGKVFNRIANPSAAAEKPIRIDPVRGAIAPGLGPVSTAAEAAKANLKKWTTRGFYLLMATAALSYLGTPKVEVIQITDSEKMRLEQLLDQVKAELNMLKSLVMMPESELAIYTMDEENC